MQVAFTQSLQFRQADRSSAGVLSLTLLKLEEISSDHRPSSRPVFNNTSQMCEALSFRITGRKEFACNCRLEFHPGRQVLLSSPTFSGQQWWAQPHAASWCLPASGLACDIPALGLLASLVLRPGLPEEPRLQLRLDTCEPPPGPLGRGNHPKIAPFLLHGSVGCTSQQLREALPTRERCVSA